MINMKENQLWDDWRYWPPIDKQVYSFTYFFNKNLVLTNQLWGQICVKEENFYRI